MENIVCFSGIEAPGAVEYATDESGKTLYVSAPAIVDGVLTTVKVYPQKNLFGSEGYALWPGPYNCTFDADGCITSVQAAAQLVVGYSISAPENGKIRLGVRDDVYEFLPDAPAYIVENGTVLQDYKTRVADLAADWSANYWLKLNLDGAIETMYIWRQMTGAPSNPLLDEIKKFQIGAGPEVDGLSVEYTYYEPVNPPLGGGPRKAGGEGTKHPVFIWLHGLHGGTSIWTSHFEWNPIASWAGDKFQSRFDTGGAYIIVPRANEDLTPGHGITWNQAHVEPTFAAIDDFLANHPNADPKRVYCGGYSMGGGMTWLLIRARPDYFAATVPCCPTIGYLPTPEELPRFAKLPIWNIVGKGDKQICKAVKKLAPELLANAEAVGTDSRLLVLPNGYLQPDKVTPIPHDHCVWIPMFNDLEYLDGTPYVDLDGVPVKSGLIAWLNGC